jgi:hypothetical protein
LLSWKDSISIIGASLAERKPSVRDYSRKGSVHYLP